MTVWSLGARNRTRDAFVERPRSLQRSAPSNLTGESILWRLYAAFGVSAIRGGADRVGIRLSRNRCRGLSDSQSDVFCISGSLFGVARWWIAAANGNVYHSS